MPVLDVELGKEVRYEGAVYFVAGLNTMNGSVYLENKRKTRFETITEANAAECEVLSAAEEETTSAT